LIEPDVRLERHQSVVPDLAGWTRVRLPDLPSERPITTVPDWICEVVSPADRGRDRVRKADLYLRTGVGFASHGPTATRRAWPRSTPSS